MRATVRSAAFERFNRIRRQRRFQNAATLGLVILGPSLALLTYLVLGPLEEGANSPTLRLVILGDIIYVLVVAALVMLRIMQMISARRAHSAGSRLHLRLTGVFALVALVPTILVAVFAALTINFGLEGWFSDRVRQVVSTSLAAAQAYEKEHQDGLTEDVEALADFLDSNKRAKVFLSDGDIRQLLGQGQARIQRGLREAYVIDGTGQIRARGERSYLFYYEKPTARQLERARSGETVLIEDWNRNEFRALTALDAFPDRYLYVTRQVDGNILNLLDDTQATIRLYNQLESERGRLLFEFGILYLGFALILILAAVWLGLWFAGRLSSPIGRLAGAAERVGSGDLDVRVIEEEGDDEIAMLGRLFNQMTRQLKGQRDALLETNRKTEEQRRLFDSVLSSVTTGVIGLTREGQVSLVNRSARRLLALTPGDDINAPLSVLVPEFSRLFALLRDSGAEVAQDEIQLIRNGKLENLLARMATRRNAEGDLEGYVVVFDDVTDLVTAQRMAAWGDVARRIAHEIKNPLTPIQLSAERLKRKFRPLVGEHAAELEQYTDVIVRQTNDLRRIVDEFSRFARMPEPERRTHDLAALVRDAVVLQQNGQPDVAISANIPGEPVMADVDATMIGQALTNLMKNAGEAIEAKKEKGIDGFQPKIRVGMELIDGKARITIADNGIGLPADRARLFEPYVTTREKGTGLGLAIVKKIIVEHGGTLELTDASPDAPEEERGAMAIMELPVARAPVVKERLKDFVK